MHKKLEKILMRRGILRDFMSATSILTEVKIKSDLHGDMKKLAEMPNCMVA